MCDADILVALLALAGVIGLIYNLTASLLIARLQQLPLFFSEHKYSPGNKVNLLISLCSKHKRPEEKEQRGDTNIGYEQSIRSYRSLQFSSNYINSIINSRVTHSQGGNITIR